MVPVVAGALVLGVPPGNAKRSGVVGDGLGGGGLIKLVLTSHLLLVNTWWVKSICKTNLFSDAYWSSMITGSGTSPTRRSS